MSNIHRKREKIVKAIHLASNKLIPIEDIQYNYKANGSTSYKIRMPVTNVFIEFEIPKHYIRQHVLTKQVCELIDHYTTYNRVMQIARDFRPYNSDLTPITREEVTKFRVRENQPNLCIPKNSWITASGLLYYI